MDKKLEPKIRFKGFNDAWEQRKLGDIAEETVGGGTPKTSNLSYWDGSLPWIQSSDLVENNPFVVNYNKAINELALKNSAAKRINSNSIAIVTRVGVGKVALIKKSYASSQDFLSLCDINIDLIFATYVIWKAMQETKIRSQGTSIKGVSKKEVLKITIQVPGKNEEQHLLSDLMFTIDNLITANQRKEKLLQELKKLLMQNVFPKNGQKNPDFRFRGFTDDWEQRKLSSIFKKRSERNPGNFGKESWISVANMFFQSPDKVLSNHVDTRTYVMKKGDVAFEGHPNKQYQFGRFVENDIGDGIVSELFPIYKHIDKYDLRFWKYFIHSEKIMNRIISKALTSSGNSSNKINDKDFLRQQITIPTLNEQQKVGKALADIDNLITANQQKTAQLKDIKKFLMQNMFI